MSNLLRMAITPVHEGGYMAEVMTDNGVSAASKPFKSTDEASAWGTKFAEEADKAADQDWSPEIKASLHSVGGVPLEEMQEAAE